jgi:hypothetical protein
MTTVADLVRRVQTIQTQITSLQTKISDSYEAYIHQGATPDTTMENDYTSKADMYDRLFQEQEAVLQASGGKSRAQTLQEYVLLFFFIAFAILSITVTVFSQMKTGKGIQVFGLMALIIVLSSGFIIRYG